MKKLMMVLTTAFAAAMPLFAETPGLTATANGYTWTFTLLDGLTAAITKCSPEPERDLVIPSGVDLEVWKDGALITHVPVSSIEAGCFANCTKLASVQCPKTIDFLHIRDNAFSGCSNLVSIAMHSGLASIGKKAFAGCAGLSEIRVPKSVEEIGEGAFSGCRAVTNMVLPFVGRKRGASLPESFFSFIFGTDAYEGGRMRNSRTGGLGVLFITTGMFQ